MLRNAVLFAGSGLAIVMLAPSLLPVVEKAANAPASTRAGVASNAPQPTPTEIAEIPQPAPSPTRSEWRPEPTYGEFQIPDNGHNQYVVDATIKGRTVRFIVDTGATGVALNTETAKDLGFPDYPWNDHVLISTANGRTAAYKVMLPNVQVGAISVDDVEAVASPGLGDMNLLGMNFLRRLSKVEQRDGTLILRQ